MSDEAKGGILTQRMLSEIASRAGLAQKLGQT